MNFKKSIWHFFLKYKSTNTQVFDKNISLNNSLMINILNQKAKYNNNIKQIRTYFFAIFLPSIFLFIFLSILAIALGIASIWDNALFSYLFIPLLIISFGVVIVLFVNNYFNKQYEKLKIDFIKLFNNSFISNLVEDYDPYMQMNIYNFITDLKVNTHLYSKYTKISFYRCYYALIVFFSEFCAFYTNKTK